jgi:serine/threonine protein kinase
MQPIFAIKDYILLNLIGKGSFGEVYLTQKVNYPYYLATKIMDVRTINPILQGYLLTEMSLMQNFNHPNIIHLFDLLQTNTHYYVIMEYCNGGTLSSCLEKYGKPFPIEIIQHLMRQIVNGLKYIHFNRIIHRDLKPDNILLNFKNIEDKNNMNLLSAEVKIIDFGLARQLKQNELANTAIGSPIHMDPLILKKYNKAGGYEKLQGYNEKADIWSLGTIFYQMLTGEQLFNVSGMDELQKKIELGYYKLPTKLNLTEELISFINGMLQYDGELRLSADELSKHDFLVKNVNNFTPANLNLISDKVKGFDLIINSKKNTTIRNMFNKKENKGHPEWEAYINGLLSEYHLAKEYFKENNLTNQEQIANNIYGIIQQINVQYTLGNYSYMKSLPKPITPEFIYGCSTEERGKKFNEVLSKYLDDKDQLENKINSFDKNSPTFNDDAKLEYEQYLSELQNYEKKIEELDTIFNNEWSPPPEYIKESKECAIEKLYHFNYLKIEIKKIDDREKESLDLIVSLKFKDAILFNKEVKLNKGNNYYNKWTWTINTKDWLNISDFFLKIENNTNSSNNGKRPVKVKVNIGKVKSGKAITYNSAIWDDKKEAINVIVNPYILEGKKYLTNEKRDIINIKIYPPFNGKSSATKNIPDFDNLK